MVVRGFKDSLLSPPSNARTCDRIVHVRFRVRRTPSRSVGRTFTRRGRGKLIDGRLGRDRAVAATAAATTTAARAAGALGAGNDGAAIAAREDGLGDVL